MVSDRLGNVLHALDDILEREHALLMKGELVGAFRLAPHKQKLLDHPALAKPAPDRRIAMAARRVQKKAIRNGQLLTAAIEGVRAAMNEIEKLKRGVAPLKTYGRDGQCRSLSESDVTGSEANLRI